LILHVIIQPILSGPLLQPNPAAGRRPGTTWEYRHWESRWETATCFVTQVGMPSDQLHP
jgi:hypothetical protein